MTELSEGDDVTYILPKKEKMQRRLQDPPVLPDLNKIPSLVVDPVYQLENTDIVQHYEFEGKKVVIDLNQLAS